MITPNHQTSQITPNWNKIPLTKNLSENPNLKFLCDVIFLPLPSQSNIPYFTMAIFDLEDYHW